MQFQIDKKNIIIDGKMRFLRYPVRTVYTRGFGHTFRD